MIKRFASTAPEPGETVLCGGKAAYDTALQAHGVRKIRQPKERAKIWVYKCQDPRCPYFHLTKLKPPREWL